ncbi:hypothetical protein C0991_007683 [Blastosporella zonata]|nr:hypothetical protein C0991_007683 [Blastosporella zonata]
MWAELKLLAPGLVYVRIHGGKRTFDSIGIKNISDANGEKDLHFLTACGATYGLHVIGNEKLFEADNIDSLSSPFGAVLEEKLTASVNIRAAVATAYINGGFYNRFNLKFPNSTADKGKAEHATIGFARTLGRITVTSSRSILCSSSLLDGIVLPFIDPPAKYLDKYETVNLTGQSVVTGAPAIARNGDPAFTDADMVEDRYKYNPDNITPGLLNHAEHPNPRSAIIVPTSPGRNANYLLLAAFSTSDKRGAEATGFTMVEWARVASRLARLDDRNGQPMNSIALNLDGGASTVMGADLGGLKLLDVRQHKETRTPYLVAMVPINKV